MVVRRDTLHLERSPLKDVAPRNIEFIPVTLDTSHFEMSPLNDFLSWNKILMPVILDTSHSPIGPCGPFEQAPLGGTFRHASMALLSSALDRGEKARGRGRGHSHWEPLDESARAKVYTSRGSAEGED